MPSERETYVKDFEISCLFRGDLKQGDLVKNAVLDVYKNAKIEAMFQGYVMGKRAVEGKLKRYAPDRFVSNGFVTQLREELDLATNAPSMSDTTLRAIVPAVLKVAGGNPA
jgi:hypothetical protein